MKSKLTLLALLFAGVINLQAQNGREPTPAEAAWEALHDAAKETDKATIKAAPNGKARAKLETVAGREAAKSPEALALRDQILGSQTITAKEVIIAVNVEAVAKGPAAKEATFRALAASDKTGTGVTLARAVVKYLDKDTTGWTLEMVKLRFKPAVELALKPSAAPEFKALVWDQLQTKSAHERPSRKFFKEYRSTVPAPAQIEATQRQKNLMLQTPMRSAAANAWLAQMSADLIALQLDQ